MFFKSEANLNIVFSIGGNQFAPIGHPLAKAQIGEIWGEVFK